MKNFDLEAAKRGAAVCTRDGRNGRIVSFDRKGRGGKPILALIDMDDWEQCLTYTERGENVEDYKDDSDLMMRDDDYLEKLERGEYGNHVEDKPKMADPPVKENLTTDREYWRRVYAGRIAEGIASHNGLNIIGTEAIVAKASCSIADALIEELEKTEKRRCIVQKVCVCPRIKPE